MSAGKTITPGAALNSVLTLWKCPKCHSSFSIESFQHLHSLTCLICQDTPLHFCGVEQFSETSAEDDTCSDCYFDGWWECT